MRNLCFKDPSSPGNSLVHIESLGLDDHLCFVELKEEALHFLFFVSLFSVEINLLHFVLFEQLLQCSVGETNFSYWAEFEIKIRISNMEKLEFLTWNGSDAERPTSAKLFPWVHRPSFVCTDSCQNQQAIQGTLHNP